MRKIYKVLLTVLVVSTISLQAVAQQQYWTSRSGSAGIAKDKAVERPSFPKEFKVFDLNVEPLRQQLFSAVSGQAKHSTIISLPNADGNIEQFEVYEASNFEPDLQARFPEIRAFSGKGLTDKYATLKLSISPAGIQTMVFRTDKSNEFIEAYSKDHTVYAVFRSQREKGQLAWTCSTNDKDLASNLHSRISANRIEANNGVLKTVRLAQSCTAEYSNFFGATSSAQVGLVLAAFNATLSRCNGVYEKDLAVHLNLISNTTDVIYYNPSTDPYSNASIGLDDVTPCTSPSFDCPAVWNNELQGTLTTVIGEANYDIGHLFGASGGGGNAGCIGCVCDALRATNSVPSYTTGKGSGITSPADNVPQGDNFDIDYVVHEVGHQLGATHTFTFSSEGGPVASSTQREVGSGISIMGYAGITPGQDVAPHSIAYYHAISIQQIQANLATKSCPVTTSVSATNATPVVAALSNYAIPVSTPFALTGSATDANAGDALTYQWEQNDATVTLTGGNSIASPTKTAGPNWVSFNPTSSPTRLFPRLSTVLAGLNVTPTLGGDAGANSEALSSVARTLNFRLTVRDNSPYVSTTPVSVGQTGFADMTVTVVAGAGPFRVTSPNTAVSWESGSSQTITWDVNNTNSAPINCANVKISLSTDGGTTFPTVLAASTANDGSEALTIPGPVTTTARIKIEAVGNIFFDISNANFSITVPAVNFTFGTTSPAVAACPAAATMSVTIPTISNGGFSTGINMSVVSGVPGGHNLTFAPANPITPGNNVVATLDNTNTLTPGSYSIVVQGVAGAITQNTTIVFTVNAGSGPVINTHPATQTICAGNPVTFSVSAVSPTGYQWQSSPDGTNWTNIGGATNSSYTIASVTPAMSGTQYHVIVSGQCGTTTSNAATLTVNTAPAITNPPASLALCSGSPATFTVTATGSNLTYVWEVSTNGGGLYTPIPGANGPSYNIPSTTTAMNNNMYHVIVSGACPSPVTSAAATLVVSSSITITSNPANKTICEGTGTTFTVAADGAGLTYQWQSSPDGIAPYTDLATSAVYSGVTSATLTLTNVPPSLNGRRYRAIVSNGSCTPGTSTGALLTVNTFPTITTQPQNSVICEGAGSSFTVAAATGVGTLSYQWQVSTDGTTFTNIPGATGATYTQTNVPVGQNGYKFKVIVTAGCGSVQSSVVTATVNAYPVITFTTASSTVCLSDGAISLSATPAGGTFSGTGVSGTSFTPSVAGLGAKAVTYTVSNAGCQSTVTNTILVNECSERHLRLADFTAVAVYPSPSNGDFSIRMNTDLYTKINIKLYDGMGHLVKTQVATGLTYGSVISVHTFNLSNGTYHLYLTSDENGGSKRGSSMIIQKY